MRLPSGARSTFLLLPAAPPIGFSDHSRGLPATTESPRITDGSCWTEVIVRLQARGFNSTSVQNPLTNLPEAVAAARAVLERQDGPTVFVGHSFSGMILTEAGVHPKVSALVYVLPERPMPERTTRLWRR